MVGEHATDECKPIGSHRTLGLISIIDELNLMEGDLLKGEHQGISHHLVPGTNQ